MSNPERSIQDETETKLAMKQRITHRRIESLKEIQNCNPQELKHIKKKEKFIEDIERKIEKSNILFSDSVKDYQQLILIIGQMKFKTTFEILLGCKKIGYSGKLDRNRIKYFMTFSSKKYFKYDPINGWGLTREGRDEFLRLKSFL